MLCPNCGNNVPEGSAFCGECGTPMQAPVAPVAPVAPAAPAQKRKTTKAAKGNEKLVLITMLISLLLVVFSVLSALNMPFYDIPAMSTLMTLAGEGESFEAELLDGLEQTVEELEEDLEYQEDVMDDDEYEAAEMLVEGMRDLYDNCSINQFKKLVNMTEEVGEEYFDDSDLSDIKDVAAIMDVLVIAVWGFFALPIVFHLLGGLCKSRGLTITAMVFTALSQLVFSGLLWVALSLAVGIVQVVLCNKIRNAKLGLAA